MKVLIAGSGAREHALAWAFAKGMSLPAAASAGAAPGRDALYCAPGNAGTEEVAKNVDIDPENPKALVSAARELGIDLVVVGPEGPLAAGAIDALGEAGIPAFGPPMKAAALEASKAFARAFSERWGVPCARTARFSDKAALRRFVDESGGARLVLKKSGLAAGKGVLESDDRAELLAFGESVLESDELLAEEYLVGRELSIFALCDGKDYLVLPACADHKKAGRGDSGPNTGGMGAVCPVPYADAPTMARIEREIVAPSFKGMEAEGLSYRGVLFLGVMLTAEGPKLLEYNVRFGDPETQSLLPLLETGVEDLAWKVATGSLASFKPRFSAKTACGVVVAAPGYPGHYPKGLHVDLDGAGVVQGGDALLFHASTARGPDGRALTGGGRCFTAVGLGDCWEEARSRAYALATEVRFEGAWFRPDIGERMHSGL
jgi:phosphoribosylamine--glycine ligase